MNLSRSPAFTLIELLVVVAIIGILAAIVTPNVVTQIERAKFTKTAALIQTLEVALETYKIDYKRYPPSMYNQNPRKAIDPSQFYKIIGERAKSAVSVKGKDLKEFDTGASYWTKARAILQQGGVPASVLTAPQVAGSSEKPQAIVDAWGNPLYYVSSNVYCPNRKCLNAQTNRPYMDMPISYRSSGSASGQRGEPNNPNTFQIISFGPDGTTLPANEDGGIGSNVWDDQRDNDGDNLVDRGDNPQTTTDDTPAEDDVTNF